MRPVYGARGGGQSADLTSVLFIAPLILDEAAEEPTHLMVSRGSGSGFEMRSGMWTGVELSSPTTHCAVSGAVAASPPRTATRDVVQIMGVPAIAAGWILGVVTSLPEAVTFFTVFSDERAGGEDPKSQIQELLDNLAASNMSNSGLIYPLGLTIFLLGTAG